MIGRIALAAALAAVLVGRAMAQDDVDEMKKRYKDMPGGDIIAAQLEAHRAEIEAGMAKQKAAMHQQGLDKPAKSPKAILAMIPPAPKTVDEADARRGKVENGSGGKIDGDAKSAAAIHELYVALTAQGREQASAGPGEAGIVPGGQGQAIKKLDEDARALQQEEHDAVQAFLKAMQAAEKEHDAKLGQLSQAVHKRLADGHCDDEGEGPQPTAAQKAACARISAGYKADVIKQRQAFMAKVGSLSADLRKKTAGWAQRGEALEAQAKTITAPALRMPVTLAKSQVRSAQLHALTALTEADNTAVLRGSERMPVAF